LINAGKDSTCHRSDTIYIREGASLNSAIDDKRFRRTSTWNTPLVFPSLKSDPKLGYDLTTGNLVTITCRTSKGATIQHMSIDDFQGETEGYRFTDLRFGIPTQAGDNTNNRFLNTANGGGHDVIIDDCIIQGDTSFTRVLDQSLWTGIALAGNNIGIQDNIFSWISICFNHTGGGDDLCYTGNTHYQVWEDIFKSAGGSNHYVCWNDTYEHEATVYTDPLDQIHADYYQWVGPTSSVDNIQFIGNRNIIGLDQDYEAPRGQGFFQDDLTVGSRTTNLIIAGNIHISDISRAVTWQESDDGIIRSNSFVSDPVHGIAQVGIYNENKNGGVDQTGTIVRDNIAHIISLLDTSNFEIDNNDTSLDYTDLNTHAALFVDPVGGSSLTIANVETKYAPKASSAIDVADHFPIIGAIAPSGRTAIVDYDARTIDFPWQETGHTPSTSDLVSQATATEVTTTEQISGSVSTTGAEIYFTGGNLATLEIRDTNNVTIIETGIPESEHRIIYANQNYTLTDTTAGTASTQTDVILVIGTNTDTWSHTTGLVDSTGPTLSNPIATADGQNNANGTVDTNESNGTLYWVVVVSGSSAPTITQIIAGTDGDDLAASDSGSQAVSTTGTQTLSPAASGLTASTNYVMYFAQQDTSTNDSNVVNDTFTSAAIPLNLLTNGDFVSGTGWTGASWTISGGVAAAGPAAVFANLTQSGVTVTPSTSYHAEFTMDSVTDGTGNIILRVHETSGGSTQHQTNIAIPSVGQKVTVDFSVGGSVTAVSFNVFLLHASAEVSIDNAQLYAT